jgi:hypothetical protein
MISYVWMAHDPFLINKLFDFSCKPYWWLSNSLEWR